MRYTQENISMNGWAIECRINAEDPYNGFMPSTGRISHVLQPTGPGVRIDTGIYPGFEISPYYDSLMSKLIVWGETRAEALLRMRRALEEYRIIGIHTNIPFHQNLMDSHRFMAGQYDTRFVEDRFSMGNSDTNRNSPPEIAAIIATLVAHRENQLATNIIQRNTRDTSNWKWLSRWERLQK
jgi:acetyl-CoA carboxylase, biotin carboxylase subunit